VCKKAKLVANGSRCKLDTEESCLRVVVMETVQPFGFPICCEMNGLKICDADISSLAYLHGKRHELCYIIARPEFGDHMEKNLLLTKVFTV
jgi:hypothetical protein